MLIRAANLSDIHQIVAIEQIPEFRHSISSWPAERHAATQASSDARYLIAESHSGEVEGFAILLGLENENRSIELKRLAVRATGQGLGRRLLAAAMEVAFVQHRAHRLWLDVFEQNVRAQHVYESVGFRHDGVFREADYYDGSFRTLYLMSILDREYWIGREAP